MCDRSMTCCFTGNRPEKLPWGNDEQHPDCLAFKRALYAQLETLVAEGYRRFICGMARGGDTWFAEAVLQLKKNAACGDRIRLGRPQPLPRNFVAVRRSDDGQPALYALLYDETKRVYGGRRLCCHRPAPQRRRNAKYLNIRKKARRARDRTLRRSLTVSALIENKNYANMSNKRRGTGECGGLFSLGIFGAESGKIGIGIFVIEIHKL